MFYFWVFFVFIAGLCWGSFLNVIAHRLACQKALFTMCSRCPHCGQVIALYDNVPVISFIFLRGKCRSCQARISPLYPFIELLTATLILALFCQSAFQHYYFIESLAHLGDLIDIKGAGDLVRFYTTLSAHAYALFFVHVLFLSALIVAIRTDFEAMVIPQCASIWLVPVGVFLSKCGLTGVSWQESMLGSVLGYGILWTIAFVFKKMANKDGMGVGDMELLAMIGSFLGPLGAWLSLFIASMIGFVGGISYLLIAQKNRATRIPFGPFLALGALCCLFFREFFVAILFN